jgi:YVTN family beta-propeller protein
MTPRIRPALCFAVLLPIALTLPSCRTHDFPQYPASFREYAYVTNGSSGTVTVLDAVNLRLDREFTVGPNPTAVAASPTRNEVYVISSGPAGGNGSLAVIDAERNAVSTTIPLHHQPVSIDVAPDGALAYVANSGSDSISVIDLKARREVAQIETGREPVAARLSPDGNTLVVANHGAGSVTLIDPVSRRVRAVFEGCPGAAGAVILPDSTRAFIPCSSGHQVMALFLSHLASPRAAATGTDSLLTLMDVGQGPVQLALKPDGGELFVSNSASDTISEIVTSTADVGGAYPIGEFPIAGLVSRDNSLLYVANEHSQYVTIYSIDDGKRLKSVRVGDGPSALAFSTAGNLLFVVDSHSGDVAVVRTALRSLFTLLPAGRNPNAIAVKSFTVK